jgi:dienelactone hydrolase
MVEVAGPLLCVFLSAVGDADDPPTPVDGERMLAKFFESEVAAVEERWRGVLSSRDAWERARPERLRELREMLGLDPEPERTDLRPVVTGILERPDLGIAVEKLHFQSLPQLYVTGNLYRPLKVDGRLPAVLYLCGHGQVKVGDVAYGAKVHYQHHPTWFARNGYVCLVIDTLQFGEIEGFHHGTYRLDMWWWVARGYTPAGVEAWNSIRALDYLASRPEVDAVRLGVTGRSGGGIGSWWLGGLDDRIRSSVPVAGITDLRDHVLTGCIEGHCDCNYPVNLHRWDFPVLAALSAPKALLHANSDKDTIFPLGGVMRVHGQLRPLWKGFGAEDRLGLAITEGPHKDSQELQVQAFRWLDRWLREENHDLVEVTPRKCFEPQDLKVFAALPADQRNTSIHEDFVPERPLPPVPASRAAFESLRFDLLARLRVKTFRNSPVVDPAAPPVFRGVAEAKRKGLVLRGYLVQSDDAFCLPLWFVARDGEDSDEAVVLRVVGEEGWRRFVAALAGDFAAELGVGAEAADPEEAERLRRELAGRKRAIAVLAPRGIGLTRWDGDAKRQNQVRRRFLVLGRVLEECWVHDVRQAVRVVQRLVPPSKEAFTIEAEGDMAAVALYAALFEPRVERLQLWSLPSSHRRSLPLMNVLRVLDIPQALALVFPRRVVLYDSDEAGFEWTRRAAALFEKDVFVERRSRF